MKERISSIEELSVFTEKFLAQVKQGDFPRDKALVVGLSGDLGAGKTAFVKQVAQALGVEGVVTSPTFVIEKIYKLPEGSMLENSFTHVIHIDAYRLDDGEELKTLGWDQIAGNSQNIIFIEWPEQVKDILPREMREISFTFIDENTRDVEW